MTQVIRLTIREVGEQIQQRFGGNRIPDWKLRRVIDSLEESDLLNVQRVARYRTISADHLEVIADELRRIGWLHSGATIGMNAAGPADPHGRIPTPAAG